VGPCGCCSAVSGCAGGLHRRRGGQVGRVDPAGRGGRDRTAGSIQSHGQRAADVVGAVHRPRPRAGRPARAGGVVPAAAGHHRGQPDPQHRHRRLLPGHRSAGGRVRDQQLHRRRRAAHHHHAAQRGRRHDAGADPDLPRQDQRPVARCARRGDRPLGPAGGPGGAAQHRPAAVDSGLDGKADEGRPGEAGGDLDRRRQPAGAITQAEGAKQAQILDAEGAKQAAILAAEADRQSRILRAQGERAAAYLRAQGQAKAIEKTFAAIKAGRPTPEMLAYQYLQTLPEMARGDANKVWVVPSDFSAALQGFTKLLGHAGRRRGVPVPAVPGRRSAQARRRTTTPTSRTGSTPRPTRRSLRRWPRPRR
jgi:hypothetical protein